MDTFKTKTYTDQEITLRLQQSRYTRGGGIALFLEVAEDCGDDYFEGESWSGVTVNLPGLTENEFALDNDFTSFCEPSLVKKVLKKVAVTPLPHRYIPSGFVDFPVYEFNPEFLATVQD